jgi:hypothetical protein
MPWLIDTDSSAARQRHLCDKSPALIGYSSALETSRAHLRDKMLDVIAHQIELMPSVFVRRMHGNL